jgi:hypothetical protein
MAKYLDCWLSKDQKIKTDIKLKEIKVNLKGKSMTGFNGIFKTRTIEEKNPLKQGLKLKNS